MLALAVHIRAGDAPFGNVHLERHRRPTLDHTSVGYIYITALHWSLSQFTGGMDEVRAQNTGERLFAVAAFLQAFVMKFH